VAMYAFFPFPHFPFFRLLFPHFPFFYFFISSFVCIIKKGDHQKSSNNSHDEDEKNKSGFADHMKSWGNDLWYLLKNKSYVLSTIAFTCLTFCTGALSWWGPLFLENALKVRAEHQLEGFENDPDTSE
jgi:hypothetical protein